MNMLALIRFVLELANFLLRRLDAQEQQKIGEDRVIKKSLTELVLRTDVAKAVADASREWDRAELDERLREYYRD